MLIINIHRSNVNDKARNVSLVYGISSSYLGEYVICHAMRYSPIMLHRDFNS